MSKQPYLIFNQFTLENYRGMPIYYACPGCGNETFQRYVSNKTGLSLSNHVGKCKAKKKCGYHYGVYNYSVENNIRLTHEKLPISFVERGILTKSLIGASENDLHFYLKKEFGESEAIKAMEKYSIGTATKKLQGSPIYWRIDKENKVRTGWIASIDPQTGEHIGNEQVGQRWIHHLLNKPRFNAVQCLFGEDLLNKEPSKSVVIVYKEITAIIASCIYPNYLWLAMPRGLETPNKEIFLTLSNRTVIWFPTKGFERIRGFN